MMFLTNLEPLSNYTKNETGLHARPASLFVKGALRYKSDIRIIKDGQDYNAKSIMGILSMGAGKGDKLTIIAASPGIAIGKVL